MRINTPTHKISLDESYAIVCGTVEWCKGNLRSPEIHRRKNLCIMVHRSENQVYGEYCYNNNWLTINIRQCINIKDIVSTTIHEYTHFLQKLDDYAKKTKEVGYNDNPYEVEARENEKLYTTKCWKQIKNNI